MYQFAQAYVVFQSSTRDLGLSIEYIRKIFGKTGIFYPQSPHRHSDAANDVFRYLLKTLKQSG